MADHGWVIAVDGEGAEYFFNNNTQESAWELPADVDPATVKKQAKWAMIEDGGSFYFYNNVTGDSVWEKPDDFDGIDLTPVVEEGESADGDAGKAEEDVTSPKSTISGVVAAKKMATKWLAVVDDDSGGTYYYNNVTGECQWEKPDDFDGAGAPGASKEEMEKILKAKLKLAALDSETRNKIKAAQAAQKEAKESGKLDWVECYDPSSDAFYYTNKVSGETTWDKPEAYMMAADDEMMHAVVKIQCMFRGKIARGEVTIKKRSVWKEIIDPDSGGTYYHNTKTGDITWERPMELGGPILDPAEAAARKEAAEKSLTGALSMKLKEARLDDDTRKRLKEAKARQQLAMDAGLVGKWVECFDPSSDDFYYYNAESGETTWEKPKNYVMAADNEMMHAVVKIQCLFRARMARRRALGMVAKTRTITSDRHQEALDRMKRLNEEEEEMKRQMEKLKKERDFKNMTSRQKKKAIEEAKARAAEERAEKERQEAREQKEMDFKLAQEKRREAARVAEEVRKMRRKKKLAAIEKKMKAKREAERKAKEEADRQREKEREIRRMKRARAARLKKEQWKKDCKAWKELWTKSQKEELSRKRDRDAAAHKEFMQARSDKTARERFSQRRAARQDAAIRSIWDAAMHGVTRERVNVLLNLAIADAAQAQAQEENPDAVPEVVAGALRKYKELSAGVGTAPQSRALYNIDMGNEIGESPLHVAAWRGHADVVAALIQRGANVNLVDTVYLKTTPLHEAVRGGWRACVRELLKGGADVMAQDCMGDTPLHLACRQNDVGVAGQLLDADGVKASARVFNGKGKLPGHLATSDAMRHMMDGFKYEPAPEARDTVPPLAAAPSSSRKKRSSGRRRSNASRVTGRRGSQARSVARSRAGRSGSVVSGVGAGGWR